tara:strand:+ start:798 stop:1520 length:723 start_codon:yes stop_codon:yes gene_type:complete
MIIILLIFIVSLYLLYTINRIESFNNKHYTNIFKTNIFDNKTIFLIANNRNISEKTIKFLDNYKYDDSFVVRFRNDPYKLITNVYKNKTDMMIYRAILDHNDNYKLTGFHGLTPNNNNIKYNVLTYTKKKIDNKLINKTQFDLINNINHIKIKKQISQLKYNKYLLFTEWFGSKEHTSGFSTLKSIIDHTKFKKIYLVGFSSLANNCDNKIITTHHNSKKECKYFQNLDKTIKDKIEILL